MLHLNSYAIVLLLFLYTIYENYRCHWKRDGLQHHRTNNFISTGRLNSPPAPAPPPNKTQLSLYPSSVCILAQFHILRCAVGSNFTYCPNKTISNTPSHSRNNQTSSSSLWGYSYCITWIYKEWDEYTWLTKTIQMMTIIHLLPYFCDIVTVAINNDVYSVLFCLLILTEISVFHPHYKYKPSFKPSGCSHWTWGDIDKKLLKRCYIIL